MQREWRASVVLVAESLLLGTRVSVPVLEDLARVLEDIVRICASSPFNNGCQVTEWSHPYQRRSSPSR
jgi:hypothetical protein